MYFCQGYSSYILPALSPPHAELATVQFVCSPPRGWLGMRQRERERERRDRERD
jgi:hypothetical protein